MIRTLLVYALLLLVTITPVLAQPTTEQPVNSKPIKFSITLKGGPSTATLKQLEIMKKYDARATFFLDNKKAAANPALVQQIIAGGHEIGGRADSPIPAAYEIADATKISGTPSHAFKSIYGEDNDIYLKPLPALGIALAYWPFDPGGSAELPPGLIAQRVLANLEQGSVIGLQSGEAGWRTAETLEIILREAKARGYRSVTLAELEEPRWLDYVALGSGTWLAGNQSQVESVQARLTEYGYECGGVDGLLGPKTERAIKNFAGWQKVADEEAKPAITLAAPEIRINIPEYSLSLLDNGKIIKRFDIAVGTPYEQTPVGRYAVFAKQENPTWYPGANFTDRTPVPPGVDNPLGTRWMEFAPAYGIHGTNKDWDISYPVSGGCIRMHDAEARQLYEIVKLGTPVIVVYETLQLLEKPDGVYLKIVPDIYNKKTSTEERFIELIRPYVADGYKVIRQVNFPLKETDDAYEIKIAIRPAGPAL